MHALRDNIRRVKNLSGNLRRKFSKPPEQAGESPTPEAVHGLAGDAETLLLPHQGRTVLSDDFLGWLRYVNAGMLDDGNIVAMDFAIARMPAAAVIEIGSFCGLSSNVIAHLRRRHSRTDSFFACDPWLFEGADTPDTPMGSGGITFGEYRDLVKMSCERNLRALAAMIYLTPLKRAATIFLRPGEPPLP